MTDQEFLPPRSAPSEEWVKRLRSYLDKQEPIVAAYLVTTRYATTAEGPVEQDELHLELRDPPRVAAPKALFMGLGFELPLPTGTFTFPSERILVRVRRAGLLLWARDPGEDDVGRDPLNFEIVFDRPTLPAGALDQLRQVLTNHPEVESAYLAWERLVKNGHEVSSRLQLAIDGDFGPAEASRLAEAVRPLMLNHTNHFGITGQIDPQIHKRDFLVFEQAVR